MSSGRTVAFVLVLVLLALPAESPAKYTYLGNVLQPLADIDPFVPGQVFRTWKPEGLEEGRWSVGSSADFLRNDDNTDDIDVIFSVTGAYGLNDRLTVGGVLPYLIRDPDFNESGLLDLRAFARYRLTGGASDPALGAELLVSLPTASQGGSFPLTVDTTLVSLGLAAAGSVSDWQYGLNLAYQYYLESESGDDNDLFYGFHAGRQVAPGLTGILEYSASRHTHSEGSQDDEITEATALVGVKYLARDNLTLGLGIGSGLSDSYADFRAQATLVWVHGRSKSPGKAAGNGKASAKAVVPDPPRVLGGDLMADIKPGEGGVLVQVSNRSGVKRLGERAARHLEKAGYVVPVVEEGSADVWETSYIYYVRGKGDLAERIAGLIADPGAVTPARNRLRGVGILLVLGKDLAGWKP